MKGAGRNFVTGVTSANENSKISFTHAGTFHSFQSCFFYFRLFNAVSMSFLTRLRATDLRLGNQYGPGKWRRADNRVQFKHTESRRGQIALLQLGANTIVDSYYSQSVRARPPLASDVFLFDDRIMS